jgi:hypothetical protein
VNAASVSSLPPAIAVDQAQEQLMANRAVADDRLAFDHFRNDFHVRFWEHKPYTFTERTGVATDGHKLTLFADPNRDVASDAQDTLAA